METTLVIGGACADIILPCRSDRFYADSTSCNHYYRCAGYRIWRNKCPPGTVSMKEASRPCTGRTRHCNPRNPIQRCANTTLTLQDDCTLRLNLPCKEETRLMDPKTCTHYISCGSVEQGEVIGRKPCDGRARCDLLTNSGYCRGGPSSCKNKGTGIVAIGERDDGSGELEPGSKTAVVDHTALIIGLVMTTVILLLIIGFLILIFHKRKQKKKKPPSLPALPISAPIPITETCFSPRYSLVDRPVSSAHRPVSSAHYAPPNNYSHIANGTNDRNGTCSGGVKGQGDTNPESCGIYEEIEPYRYDPSSLPTVPQNSGAKSPEIVPVRPARTIRPWSQSFEVPARRPVTRPFSLTSLSAPRPPLEPPHDSCANLDQGYAHPYFVLPSDQYPESPTSPGSNCHSPTKSHKYFILEKDSARAELDNVSMETTYCEIDDAHFLQGKDDWRTTSFI